MAKHLPTCRDCGDEYTPGEGLPHLCSSCSIAAHTSTRTLTCCATTRSGERCSRPSSRGGFVMCRQHRLSGMVADLTHLVAQEDGEVTARECRHHIRRAVEHFEAVGDYRTGPMERCAVRLAGGANDGWEAARLSIKAEDRGNA